MATASLLRAAEPRAGSSLGRRLLLSLAPPLVLFFGLTLWVLDSLTHSMAERSLQELLEQDFVAIVSALEESREGTLAVRILDPESRLLVPGSGFYAQVQDQRGQTLWRSASLAGVDIDFGPPVRAGERSSQERSGSGNGELLVRVYNRGLNWESDRGAARELSFSVAESLGPWHAQLARFRSTMLGWFIVMTVVVLGTLGWLLHLTLAPVRRLEREIAAVELGQRDQLGTGYPRELAGTAANLNALLQAEQRRISRYRDSLGSLAHELKTPLAVMRSALSQGGDARAQIEHEIDRMSAIIGRQLARAGASAGAAIGQAPVPLAGVAGELRAALLKVHHARGLRIDLELQPGVAFVGDPGDFTELLGNLLDNACKWCRGRVLLRAAAESVAGRMRLRLTVCDDGPGVAPADRERILQRGVRGDERVAGHGIGLALVSDTVELYGGSLKITAAPQLGGACFEVELPGRLLREA